MENKKWEKRRRKRDNRRSKVGNLEDPQQRNDINHLID